MIDSTTSLRLPTEDKIVLVLTVLVIMGAVSGSIGVVDAKKSDVRTIGYNQVKSGEVDTDDPVSEEFDGYHEPVTFSGSAGDFLVFNLTSEQDDAYIALVGPSGDVVHQNNADTSEWTHDRSSRLGLRLPQDGEYTIAVASEEENATFSYELSVMQPNVPTVSGTEEEAFTTDDSTIPPLVGPETKRDFNRHYADVYAFQGQSGDNVTVTHTANSTSDTDSDPFLFMITPTGTVYVDDDSGPGNDNAQITQQLDQTGEYIVIATSKNHFMTFPYMFSVTGASGSAKTPNKNDEANENDERKAPPTGELSVTDAGISTTSVHPNETVMLNASVENDGEVSGDFVLWLATDDDLQRLNETTIEMDRGEQRSILFNVSFDEPGTHTLVLSGRTIETVTVKNTTTSQSLDPGQKIYKKVFHQLNPNLDFDAWTPLFDEETKENETSGSTSESFD